MTTIESRQKATELLQIWGLRISGGSLKDPTKTATGHPAGLDEDLLKVEFVERVPDFRLSRPVLVHRYVHGLNWNSFTVRKPGETLRQALLRRGWFMYVGVPERELAKLIHDDFLGLLIAQIEEHAQNEHAQNEHAQNEHAQNEHAQNEHAQKRACPKTSMPCSAALKARSCSPAATRANP